MINNPKVIIDKLFRTKVLEDMMWQIPSSSYKKICEIISDNLIIV